MTATAHRTDLPAPPDARPSVPAPGSVTGWTAVAVGALGAGLVAARAWSVTPPPCVLRTHVGIPCPVCGLTRVAVAIGHGQVGPALRADAAGVALLAAVAVVALGQLAAVRGRPVGWLRARWLPLALGGLLLAHWATTLGGGGLP